EGGKRANQAAFDARTDCLAPIRGLPWVLLWVFVPPAFMPGIPGKLSRHFALVIAATALISAINAATLKPTQCALWLRSVDHGRRKNLFFRAFNSVYERVEAFYVCIIRRIVERSILTAGRGVGVGAPAGWAVQPSPISFIP